MLKKFHLLKKLNINSIENQKKIKNVPVLYCYLTIRRNTLKKKKREIVSLQEDDVNKP